MTIASVFEAVAGNRSLWVELECPGVLPPTIAGMTPPPDTDPLHCTLVFLGKGYPTESIQRLIELLHVMSSRHDPFESRVSGIARFRGNAAEGDPIVWLLSDPKIRAMRDKLALGLDVPEGDWDYTPHVTLGRVPRGESVTLYESSHRFIRFASIAMCAGEERSSFGLVKL